jgi:hypothetical protein
MKRGDIVEVLYAGEWIEGEILNSQNAESDPKQKPQVLCMVSTKKGMAVGVSPAHGNMREKGVADGS